MIWIFSKNKVNPGVVNMEHMMVNMRHIYYHKPNLKILNKCRNTVYTKKPKLFLEGSWKDNHFEKKIEAFILKQMAVKCF